MEHFNIALELIGDTRRWTCLIQKILRTLGQGSRQVGNPANAAPRQISIDNVSIRNVIHYWIIIDPGEHRKTIELAERRDIGCKMKHMSSGGNSTARLFPAKEVD